MALRHALLDIKLVTFFPDFICAYFKIRAVIRRGCFYHLLEQFSSHT
jgi:hypothetical protein